MMLAVRRLLARRVPGLVAVLSLTLAATGAAPVPRAATTGQVSGTVKDGAGKPIAGARVVVIGTALSTLTDRSGAYSLAAVALGPVTVRATRLGYLSAEAAGTVRAGATLTLNFTLAAGRDREEKVARHQPTPVVPREVVPSALRQERSANEMEARRDVGSVYPQSSAGVQQSVSEPWRWQREPGNTENYNAISENRFLTALSTPVSTFSIDVDAASYSNVRRFLSQGTLPPVDAVRLEEMVNYFPYRYPDHSGRHPFAVSTDVVPCPWAPAHRLVRIGLQARRVPTADLPPSNLVFLIDVSGSMQSPDKLPLVQQAFRALVNELRPEDRVAIVVYAGAAGLVLPSTSGSDKPTILDAIDRLEAGGSTAGGAGIRLAYDVAREHFDREGNNRVILATDGDFNVGVSSDAEMVRLVEQRREEGTFLTVLGFGSGNLKDAKMEQMADKGNGHYAYIDSYREARKVFVQEFGGTLFTVAKDVKIQVEFNPAGVRSYRLLGYENRLLNREDFADDRKDAGELGSGHSVTALYEVVPVGATPVAIAEDSLVYQQVAVRPDARRSGELLTVRVRYKDPQGSTSRLLEVPVTDRGGDKASEDMRFASAVAAFALLLRESEHRGQASFDQVLSLARGARGEDEEGHRGEFIGLVEAAKALHDTDRGPARVDGPS
ncbi:MAG TPA: von Willebrand factor type A domain-containing protein [Gemmatimonadales bacterium]|nr:von Willebrand factor type A domain-containing protein [Gemmatimonadales bacterium]